QAGDGIRGFQVTGVQTWLFGSWHAVECRVYAEDPARDFLPTGGTVLRLDEPAGEHVRVDSGLDEGTEVTSAYDPMLAKVDTWARIGRASGSDRRWGAARAGARI